jgi:uncharacterized protein (TIGR04552 family)
MDKLGMLPRELDVVRHVLTGGSVVDWRRMDFANREEVDAHLRLNKLDWHDPRDAKYMLGVVREAARFLEGTLQRKLCDEVVLAQDVRDIFLLARRESTRRVRMDACFVLKVSNIINHLNGRELLFRVAVSERDLTFMAHAEVSRVVDRMREEGFPIVDFEGGEKTKESLLLKLLAKRETLAAQIFDKIRFRVTVQDTDDIVAVILYFARHLFPFNYVIPGQSANEIVRIPSEIEEPSVPGATPRGGDAVDHERPLNEFSGPTYRHLDFVVDLPLRLDQFVSVANDPALEGLGSVVFAMVEFQVIDRRTANENEAGENNHEAYKERQRERVLRRLERPHNAPRELMRVPEEGDES